jgi:hypothetical protein
VKIAQECEVYDSIWCFDSRLTRFLGFDDAVPTMIQPGAGLTQLDMNFDSTDTLFDSIFSAVQAPQSPQLKDDTPRQTDSVRVYRSDEDM